MKAPCQVSVVLDRSFGDRLSSLLKDGPVWIIDSPLNQAAAQTLWNKNPGASHLEGVTLFKSVEVTAAEALIAQLDTIELHHGEYSAPNAYSVLAVIGVQRTKAIEAALGEFGFTHAESTIEGFQATRGRSA